MIVDCHMHTPLCGHASGNPTEYVKEAAAKGIGLITFTCHIPMDEEAFWQHAMRMTEDQVPDYFALIKRAAELGKNLGVQVLTGIEAEIFPEPGPMISMEGLLKAWPFDFVLGSLHHHTPAYQTWLFDNNCRTDHAKLEAYFTHLGDAVSSGRYDSFSHPDVIRIYGTVERFEPAEHEPTIRRFLSELVKHDCCMEVNTSGLSKGVYIVQPDPLILDWAFEMGVKLTMGSDAHSPKSVGQFFPEVRQMLYAKGFRKLHYFAKRQRHELDLTP